MNDRITWLLPVKNGLPFLPETLASIEAQTYRHWEILVWDDGSTDGTLEELKKWIPARLPGKILTGESLGVGGALAKLVEAAETEFCARIDADDINLPHRLETQLAYLKQHPTVAVLGSAMYRIDERGQQSEKIYRVVHTHEDIVSRLIRCNALAHPSVMFRRSAILAVGNYRSLRAVEDYDMWLRIAATHRYQLENLPIPLLKYRIHSASETQQSLKQDPKSRVADYCFYQTAEQLYGCSIQEAQMLREHRHPSAIRLFYQIAQHLQQQDSCRQRLYSRTFIRSFWHLLAPDDHLSRMALLGLALHPINWPENIGDSYLKGLSFLRRKLNFNINSQLS
jgi:hypothetical protein